MAKSNLVLICGANCALIIFLLTRPSKYCFLVSCAKSFSNAALNPAADETTKPSFCAFIALFWMSLTNALYWLAFINSGKSLFADCAYL